jgi:hypothetical protein
MSLLRIGALPLQLAVAADANDAAELRLVAGRVDVVVCDPVDGRPGIAPFNSLKPATLGFDEH